MNKVIYKKIKEKNNKIINIIKKIENLKDTNYNKKIKKIEKSFNKNFFYTSSYIYVLIKAFDKNYNYNLERDNPIEIFEAILKIIIKKYSIETIIKELNKKKYDLKKFEINRYEKRDIILKIDKDYYNRKNNKIIKYLKNRNNRNTNILEEEEFLKIISHNNKNIDKIKKRNDLYNKENINKEEQKELEKLKNEKLKIIIYKHNFEEYSERFDYIFSNINFENCSLIIEECKIENNNLNINNTKIKEIRINNTKIINSEINIKNTKFDLINMQYSKLETRVKNKKFNLNISDENECLKIKKEINLSNLKINNFNINIENCNALGNISLKELNSFNSNIKISKNDFMIAMPSEKFKYKFACNLHEYKKEEDMVSFLNFENMKLINLNNIFEISDNKIINQLSFRNSKIESKVKIFNNTIKETEKVFFLNKFEKDKLNLSSCIFKNDVLIESEKEPAKIIYIENTIFYKNFKFYIKKPNNVENLSFKGSLFHEELDIKAEINIFPNFINIQYNNELSLFFLKINIKNYYKKLKKNKELGIEIDKIRKIKIISEENKDIENYLFYNGLELDLRRKKEKNCLKKIPNFLYKIVSNYGQSIQFPFYWYLYFQILYSNIYNILFSYYKIENNLKLNFTYEQVLSFTINNSISLVNILRNPNKYYLNLFYNENIDITKISVFDIIIIKSHVLISLICMFFIILGIRNKFRLK